MKQDKTIVQFNGVTELLPNMLAVELTNLGDIWKKFQILQPDDKWEVPYLKYAYRSIYHTKNFKKDFYCGDETPLPPGSYEILFTTKGVTEEQAAQVVGQVLNGFYENYLTTLDLSGFEGYNKATESLQSLVTSKGLTAGNYLIIKKAEG